MTRLAILAKGAQKLVTDNSPVILTAFAVAGVATTAILAVKATGPALRDISEAESEHREPITSMQKAKLVYGYYIPSIAVGGATIACIIGANTISSRRQAALVSVYSLTETAFKEYREKVTETLGANKEMKVRDEMAQERINQHPVTNSQVIMTGKGEVLCYDVYSGRYFKSSMDALRKAENAINAQMIHENYASQNDFNRLIGLAPNKYGDEIGWSCERLLELDISGTISEDGEPCLSVDYRVSPNRGYHKFGG